MAKRIGQTSAKDKIAGGLRTAFTAVVGASVFLGLPAYHLYGSIEETEAKVVSYDAGYRWDDSKNASVNEYKITTNKGTFADENSKLHLKSEEDTARIWSDVSIGKTYKFKTYGIGVGPLKKNILSVSEVSEEELKERDRIKQESLKNAKKDAAVHQQQASQPVAGQPAQTAAGQPQTQVFQQGQVLSGRVSTIDIVFNNSVIQLTVPAEAAGKVTVNSVTPLQINPPAPKPPGT